MILLVGEKIIARVKGSGEFNCPVCNSHSSYKRIEERNYFTVLFFPVYPLGTVADYVQCDKCGSPFEPNSHIIPGHFEGIRLVIAYLLLGYGVDAREETAIEIYQLVTDQLWPKAELHALVNQISRGLDIMAELESIAYNLNAQGAQKIVEAAYLMTYACCEIQYRDRLRVNQIGAALGVTLVEINQLVDRLRKNSFLGIRRHVEV